MAAVHYYVQEDVTKTVELCQSASFWLIVISLIFIFVCNVMIDFVFLLVILLSSMWGFYGTVLTLCQYSACYHEFDCISACHLHHRFGGSLTDIVHSTNLLTYLLTYHILCLVVTINDFSLILIMMIMTLCVLLDGSKRLCQTVDECKNCNNLE